ncbi:MAG: hypothetical protein A2Z66_07580 [Chloroflexi bacterium RBG_13_66_10]|nr:MAG: hypothetical protein A2Z66_07580 [Chloroflexi bacterium RBG_13_66_10]
MLKTRALAVLASTLLLAGCNFPGAGAPSAVAPTLLPDTLPPGEMTPTSLSTAPFPSPPALPEEAILILEPGPGSRLVGSIHISGIADTTFEQNLGIRVLLDDGSLLAQTSTIIDVPLGNRGPFEADVPFTIAGERNAFIEVYSASPRDGGITHLNSMGVILAEAGPVDIAPASPHPEDINIHAPVSGATVSGGVVHVEGIGIASFEQTLVVTVYNADGAAIATLPLIVAAPDFGLPGTFSIDVPYMVARSQPGRITVSDPSAVFLGDNHLASVEVTLAP